MAQWVKNLLQCRKWRQMCVSSLGQEDPLKKGMTTHSSVLAWRIPGMREPGGLPSLGSESDTTKAT